MASLRRLYEKKQSNHQHSATLNSEEVTFTYAHSPAAVIALPLPTPVSFTNHLALSLLWLVFFCEDMWESSSNQSGGTSQQQSAETWAAEEQSQAFPHRVAGGYMEGIKTLHCFMDAHQSCQKMSLLYIRECSGHISDISFLFTGGQQGENPDKPQLRKWQWCFTWYNVQQPRTAMFWWPFACFQQPTKVTELKYTHPLAKSCYDHNNCHSN